MPEFGSHIYLAFAAGLISVLSPCVLPLMPAYLSLISGISIEEMRQGASTTQVRRQVIRACLGFVVGFSAVFILMGAGAVAAGQVLRTWHFTVFGFEVGISQIAGLVIVLLGLHMTGLLRIRALYRDTRLHAQIQQRSFITTAIVGAGFAFGWSPCIGPILATVLTLAGARETLLQGVILLTVYSLGLAIPFLIAGWSIEYFFQAFERVKRHFRMLEVVSGAVLIGVGLLFITNQFTTLNRRFQFMTEWVNAAEQALQ